MHGGPGLVPEAEGLGSSRLDPDSLERLVPDELEAGDVTGQEALRISVERYEFAARYARPGRLLDLACGVGYGTRLLTDRAPQVEDALGVDLSEATIAYAGRRYANVRTRYRACDAMGFEDPDGFDTVVSIETIEHLAHPRRFVEHLVSLLRPGGVLIASVPSTPSVDANPHHLQDFTERSFRGLFAGRGLREVDHFVQDQPYSLPAVLGRSERRLQELRPNLPAYYARHPRALLCRLAATLRHGFKNRYLTLALRSDPASPQS